MEKYLIILNFFVLFALIAVVFLILKNNREKKEREIRENESFKNENDKFEELKRTVSERLEIFLDCENRTKYAQIIDSKIYDNEINLINVSAKLEAIFSGV